MRFYHPLTRALVREDLGTPDEARAELLRQRIELEAEFLQPRYQVAGVPPNVRVFLYPTAPDPAAGTVTPAPAPLPSTPILPAPPIEKPRVRLDDALRVYFGFIRTDNADDHVENKLSMVRRFLGGRRSEQFANDDDPVARDNDNATPFHVFGGRNFSLVAFPSIFLLRVFPTTVAEKVWQLPVVFFLRHPSEILVISSAQPARS